MFDLLILMAHKQCYVTVMLNKRHYTIDIAVFDMFTVILPSVLECPASSKIIRLQGGPKKQYPSFVFAITSVNLHQF